MIKKLRYFVFIPYCNNKLFMSQKKQPFGLIESPQSPPYFPQGYTYFHMDAFGVRGSPIQQPLSANPVSVFCHEGRTLKQGQVSFLPNDSMLSQKILELNRSAQMSLMDNNSPEKLNKKRDSKEQKTNRLDSQIKSPPVSSQNDPVKNNFQCIGNETSEQKILFSEYQPLISDIYSPNHSKMKTSRTEETLAPYREEKKETKGTLEKMKKKKNQHSSGNHKTDLIEVAAKSIINLKVKQVKLELEESPLENQTRATNLEPKIGHLHRLNPDGYRQDEIDIHSPFTPEVVQLSHHQFQKVKQKSKKTSQHLNEVPVFSSLEETPKTLRSILDKDEGRIQNDAGKEEVFNCQNQPSYFSFNNYMLPEAGNKKDEIKNHQNSRPIDSTKRFIEEYYLQKSQTNLESQNLTRQKSLTLNGKLNSPVKFTFLPSKTQDKSVENRIKGVPMANSVDQRARSIYISSSTLHNQIHQSVPHLIRSASVSNSIKNSPVSQYFFVKQFNERNFSRSVQKRSNFPSNGQTLKFSPRNMNYQRESYEVRAIQNKNKNLNHRRILSQQFSPRALYGLPEKPKQNSILSTRNSQSRDHKKKLNIFSKNGSRK